MIKGSDFIKSKDYKSENASFHSKYMKAQFSRCNLLTKITILSK